MAVDAKEQVEGARDAEVRARVKALISDALGMAPAEIDDEEFLSSYGINSVELIDVIVKLESEYGVRFQPEAMKDLTCRSLAAYVVASLGADPA